MSHPTPASKPPARAHLQAVVGFCIGFFFLCAGTPGTRSIGPKAISPKRVELAYKKVGPLAAVYVGAVKLNFAVRVPIAKHFLKLQSVFRISQNWGLYGSGPNVVRQIQIDVDGEPVYRTNDPDLRWHAPQLTHRKIRPMPDTMSAKADAYNWTGFQRWVLEEVQQDFPEAQQVDIYAIWTSRKPGAESYIHHGRHAEAPEWVWHMVDKGGAVGDVVSKEPPE